MKNSIYAMAQIKTLRQNVEYNLNKHLDFIYNAA